MLQQELQQFLATGVPGRISELDTAGRGLTELRTWVESALAAHHLVQVAWALTNELKATPAELATIGIPVDLLELFPAWREGRREGFAVPPATWSTSVSGASRPIRILRFQLSPYSVTLSAALLLIKQLFSVTESDVLFYVTVEPGGNPEAIAALLSEFHPQANQRLRIVELHTSTVFAQDNARGVWTKNSNMPGLLLPRAFRVDSDRSRDALERQISSNSGDLPVFRSQLFWEGGNIVADENICLIGSDTLQENMNRLGLAETEVHAVFQAEFGPQVCFIGDKTPEVEFGEARLGFTTGQASFHIDLDVALPGQIAAATPIAMLADPDLALPQLDQVLALRELVQEHYLPESEARDMIEFEYRNYADTRRPLLAAYRACLEDLGYSVFGMPDLRIDPSENIFSTRNLDFTYCNVLTGLHQSKPAIFYLPYGIPVLDNMAATIYAETGCQAVPISPSGRLANLLMLFRGGLRCACSAMY